MFVGGPARHVGADLGQQPERVVRPDAIELGEVDAGELMEGRPELEAGFVVAWLLPGTGGRQRRRRLCGVRRQRLQVGFDGRVTDGELLLDVIKGFQVLSQPEEVFGPVVPREGGDDLGFRRVTAIVPMLSEGVRVGATGHDVAEDLQSRDARDVADDEG